VNQPDADGTAPAPCYLLDEQIRRLISALNAPASQDAFVQGCVARGVDEAAVQKFWQVLQEQGWLQAVNPTEQSHFLADTFGSWRNQRGMLADMYRTEQLRLAIHSLISPGDHAIDVGCGSGILSFFCAKAGAAKVHALESTPIIESARELAAANGLESQVEFVHGDAAAFSAPEPVDLVLGEWAGMWLLEEWRHFEAFAKVRDRCLKKTGQVMPRRAQLFLSPVEDSRLYVERGPGWWEKPVWGLDFRMVHQRQWDQVRRIIVQADRRSLLQPLELADIDCLTQRADAYFFEREFEVSLHHAGSCHGFIGWFRLELAPGIFIDTSPLSIDTTWHQSYFPMELMQFQPGDKLFVRAQTVADNISQCPILMLEVDQLRDGQVVNQRQHRFTLDDTQR